MSSDGRRRFPRPLALLGAALLMGTQDCDGNLGEGSPAPVSFRISIAPQQVDANGDSARPSWSDDGRYVCFSSRANNLAGPNSAFREIFVRDRLTDTVRNVSRLANLFYPSTAADCENPSMSPNGRYVVFECRNELTYDPLSPEAYPGWINLFWIDLENDPPSVNRVGVEIDGDMINPSVSDDGLVAFQSDATDVAGFLNPTARRQVYVYDLNSFDYYLISHDTGAPATPGNAHSQNPRISADGAFVVFESFATNLTPEPNPNLPSQSTGARRIYRSAFDGSGLALVSRADGPAGTPADNHCTQASLSADGRYVAFLYQGGAMTVPPSPGTFCVVRRDAVAGSTVLVDVDPFIFAIFVPYGEGDTTGISADGRFVAFTGTDGPLATATDLFAKVRDLQAGTTHVASRFILTAGGSSLDQFPGLALSADGRWVAWRGDSPLEVIGDDNAVPDVFGYGPIH